MTWRPNEEDGWELDLGAMVLVVEPIGRKPIVAR